MNADTPSRVSPSATADETNAFHAELERSLGPRSPSSPVPSSEIPNMAPHPLGAHLGPAAIKPRREGDPLLVAEIIRLLERHGVRWDQAVREAAGLMAQSVEEAEGWWAFDTCDVDSPPSRGSEEELGKLLDAWKEQIILGEDSYDEHEDYDRWQRRETAARLAVESYVSRLRDEREALTNKIVVQGEELHRLASGWRETSAAMCDNSAIIESLRTEQSRDKAALASLKEQQRELHRTATEMLDTIASSPKHSIGSINNTFVAQISTETVHRWQSALRLLSTSDSEQK